MPSIRPGSASNSSLPPASFRSPDRSRCSPPPRWRASGAREVGCAHVKTRAMQPPNTTFPAERLLLGPGPSPVPQRVLRALAAPTLGHLDPQYLAIMDETCAFLREIFRTKNALTFPVSGTGMAGMECVATNLIEPGNEVLVCINGVFGMRMKDVMERCG